eukprot:scaffold1169_cov120-Cylindrotheca_fusiformis.AAC.17
MLKNNRNTDAQRRQRVINLNNAAVSKMNKGKFEQGIQLFSNALRALAGTVTRSSPEVDVGSYQVFDDLDSHLSGLLCSVGGCDKMEDGSYMFSRPLSIPRKAAASSQATSLVSKIILFNLALSHQMLAIHKDGVGADRFLHRACKLYQLAYKVAPHSMQPIAERHLLPALVNNLGLAYSKTHDRKNASHSFQGVITLLMNANAMGDSIYRMNSNIDCYLSNACNAVQSDCRPASAA